MTALARVGKPGPGPTTGRYAGPSPTIGPTTGPTTDPDAAVVAESLHRPERFAAIYDRYFTEIYRYVAGRLGPDVADDLAAETFADAFRKRADFQPGRGALRPWLYGIATNLVARHRRVEARRLNAISRAASRTPGGPAAADPGDLQDRAAARVSAQQLRRPLARALAQLPDGDRDVLLLISVADLSYEEVAAALRIPAGTVGSRLNRARRKVRSALKDIDPGLDHASLTDHPDRVREDER
jgi:RNA polymerase sigma-70 factor (ECF subfamily)